MKKLQSDESVLRELSEWLDLKFPEFKFEYKVSIRKTEISEPCNNWLKSIYWYGHFDIIARKNGRLTCVFEPGGSAHFKNKRQILCDSKKDKLCELNRIRIVRFPNNLISELRTRKGIKLIRKILYFVEREIAVR